MGADLVTTYIALSPRRRTEHTTWKGARDSLVDAAKELAGQARKDAATRAMFGVVAEDLSAAPEHHGELCLRRYDAWGNPITFRLVAQEQLTV